MARRKAAEAQTSQPILSYTSTSTRSFELPQDTTRTLEQFAEYYNQFSGLEINANDVLASKAMELFQGSKDLLVEEYKPPKKQELTLPNGAWSGIDKAAGEKGKTDQEIIISIAKKLSLDEQFNAWLSREKGVRKRRKSAASDLRQGASTGSNKDSVSGRKKDGEREARG